MVPTQAHRVLGRSFGRRIVNIAKKYSYISLWEYCGGFTIEFRKKERIFKIIPPAAQVIGNKIIVPQGVVKDVIDGVQVRLGTIFFNWSYPSIREIRNSSGTLIWPKQR